MTRFILLFLSFIILGCKDATKEVFVNYNENNNKIFRVKDYFSKICPTNLSVYIKFNSKSNVDFKLDQNNYWDKATWIKNDIFDKYGQFHQFNQDIDDKNLIKALKLFQLNQDKIDSLYLLLDEANCNSISNYTELPLENKLVLTSVGFPTSDLYGLYYIFFNQEPDLEKVDTLLRDCSFKKINNKVFVKYGGPAFGSDCFPDKK